MLNLRTSIKREQIGDFNRDRRMILKHVANRHRSLSLGLKLGQRRLSVITLRRLRVYSSGKFLPILEGFGGSVRRP